MELTACFPFGDFTACGLNKPAAHRPRYNIANSSSDPTRLARDCAGIHIEELDQQLANTTASLVAAGVSQVALLHALVVRVSIDSSNFRAAFQDIANSAELALASTLPDTGRNGHSTTSHSLRIMPDADSAVNVNV
jgi:hypothetical protein